MSLTIGIDGQDISKRHGYGIATYGLALAQTIAQLGHEPIGIFGIDVGPEPDVREALFFDQFGREPFRKTRRQKRLEIMRSTWLLARNALDVPLTPLVDKKQFAERFPAFSRIVSHANLFALADWHFRIYGRFIRLKMNSPPDIMHWTSPIPIHLAGAKNIYTVHDLVPLRLPQATLEKPQLYSRLIEACLTRADHICTVSRSTLEDILGRFPEIAHKITNTYQVAPLPAALIEGDPTTDAAIIEAMFELEQRDYFVFFGPEDPKKNAARVIEAYLTSQTKSPLVIVGVRDQQAAKAGTGEDRTSLHGKAIDERIINLDYLPRDLMLRLVRGAKAVLCPSLFEGFGLIALEAMRLGTPVIGSSSGSMPEVMGTAGILVDPYNVGDIACAIKALDNDIALPASLGAAGYKQAAKFNNEEYKSTISAIYENII